MASDIFTVQLYKPGLRMCTRTSKALAKSGYVFEGQKVNFSFRMVQCSQERFWLQQLSPVSLQCCKELLYMSWSDLSGAIAVFETGVFLSRMQEEPSHFSKRSQCFGFF